MRRGHNAECRKRSEKEMRETKEGKERVERAEERKMKLAKKQKQNRPIPQWVRMKTGNTIRYGLLVH